MTLETPMTMAEVAALLRCTERTVRRIKQTELPWVKPGRERLYLPSAVARYLGAPKPAKEKRECGSLKRKTPRTSKPAGNTQTDQAKSFQLRLEKWQSAQQKRAA